MGEKSLEGIIQVGGENATVISPPFSQPSLFILSKVSIELHFRDHLPFSLLELQDIHSMHRGGRSVRMEAMIDRLTSRVSRKWYVPLFQNDL